MCLVKQLKRSKYTCTVTVPVPIWRHRVCSRDGRIKEQTTIKMILLHFSYLYGRARGEGREMGGGGLRSSAGRGLFWNRIWNYFNSTGIRAPCRGRRRPSRSELPLPPTPFVLRYSGRWWHLPPTFHPLLTLQSWASIRPPGLWCVGKVNTILVIYIPITVVNGRHHAVLQTGFAVVFIVVTWTDPTLWISHMVYIVMKGGLKRSLT